MNIFRLTGDLSHLAAIIILLLKIWKTRSCAGISGKSQLLFALVFTTRYLDLFTSFISLYNTSMKLIYVACSYATVYLIYMKFKATYDGNHDTFRVEFLVVPVGGLSFLVNHDFSPLEILWTFSIYLESVAILPQLFMISKTGEAETITTHYLFFLGLYRALYLINWIWRYYFEGFFDLIAVVAGVVQTILYCDFFYLYVTKVLKGKKLSLPAVPKMPGMVMFGRRWAIASDDFVFPGAFELFIRMIWWIGILVLYSIHKGRFNCTGGGLLHSYLLVLLILLAAIICAVSAIVYISMQGTISNPGPRKSLPKLLYTRLGLYIPELVWAVVGAIWVSDTDVRCERTVVNAVFGTVVASWVIIIFTIVAVVIVFDPLGGKKTLYLADDINRNLESSQSGQLFYNVKKTATRVWETRIRLLCCCIVQDDDHRVAFTSIAELFRIYFSDTDMVPTDIAAGLTLLHQEQDKVENCPKDPEEVLCHSSLSHVTDDLDVELENAAHYMQFAAAAYGWPYYIYTNPFTALCKLNGDCCRNSPTDFDMIGSDRLNFHFGSILKITGLQYRDFIHISFHNKGITQAANYIYRRLINDGILNHAFTIAPEYKLVIVGHSLGGGTASVLAIMLRNSFPTLRCYAFSPPGGLLRLSMPSMEDLKRRLVRIVANCNRPKYQILLYGCWYEVFGGDPDNFPTELDGRNQDALTQPLLAEQSLMMHRSPSYNALEDESPLNSPPRYPHLYLPGKIIHIVEEASSRRWCSSDVKYTARWSKETAFSNILISPKMITDHMPDVVLKALNSLTEEKASCITCQIEGDFHTNIV
ncbi:Sn1-specific diacylglycerol lipase beta [Chelonia mydas]|uniref:ER lumen protein-retaining receptor n=4 Tax=Testudines TaxID=8459 RepID=M7BCS2_CHEMY|nr:Sn1-specific diacylglycerol lipase beta [Chelonia mydas]